TNSSLYADRGWIQLGKPNFDGALADAMQAIKLDPKNAEAYSVRGQVRYNKDDIPGAIADFEKVIELNAENWQLLSFKSFNQGWIGFAKGDYEKAIGSWNQSIEKDAGWWRWQLQPWIEKAQAKLQGKKP
ncbi:MAG: tetratricopeptide repeat protein, partial [Verrucomicrobiota bacterium]